MRRIVQEEDR